jgi:hypothetical protein
VSATSYAAHLRDYTLAIRAYGMTEAMAETTGNPRDWTKELRRCALKARDAAQALAALDAASDIAAAWLEEAEYWSRHAPQIGVRRGDV